MKKMNIKEAVPTANAKDDPLVRMTMDQYVDNHVNAYERGWQDGMLTSTVILGAVTLGFTIANILMNAKK